MIDYAVITVSHRITGNELKRVNPRGGQREKAVGNEG